jgi:hypothetical protein
MRRKARSDLLNAIIPSYQRSGCSKAERLPLQMDFLQAAGVIPAFFAFLDGSWDMGDQRNWLAGKAPKSYLRAVMPFFYRSDVLA